MAMPLDLIIVRHGQSEGSLALKRTRQGDNSHFENPNFVERHSSQWRLTDKGIEQAHAAGEWIRSNLGASFKRYYTSEYHRAMETAAHLSLPEAEWLIHPALHERNWGDLDRMSEEERISKYAQSLADRETTPFYWTPPNGESIAQVCIRIRTVLDTLHRECSGERVVLVCHGEVMESFRATIERMPQHDYLAWTNSDRPEDRINNGQVLHYTRQNPETGEISKYLGWRRSICTSDESLSSPDWHEVNRAKYSNQELLGFVESAPRIISG